MIFPFLDLFTGLYLRSSFPSQLLFPSLHSVHIALSHGVPDFLIVMGFQLHSRFLFSKLDATLHSPWKSIANAQALLSSFAIISLSETDLGEMGFESSKVCLEDIDMIFILGPDESGKLSSR